MRPSLKTTIDPLHQKIQSLNRLYVNYTWRPYQGKVVLIRSSENQRRRDKKFHVRQWSRLTNNLIVKSVEGHHLTLFEEPEVQGLAQEISRSLIPQLVET